MFRRDVPTTASTTYRKGDLLILLSGAASTAIAAWPDVPLGVCAEAATVNSSTVPGSVAVANRDPNHVWRVQYTGTPDAAALMGGTVDISNCATVNAADVTPGSGRGLILDRALDTTNGWAYVRIKNPMGYV